MGLDFEYHAGQTPLDPDEVDGLRIDSIATRGELDEFEQQNIEEAVAWVLTRSFTKERVLTERFIRQLHGRMYGNVWAWAGDFRKTEKNIGIAHWKIAVELRVLLDDTKCWIAQQACSPDELALRFKHRIVSIHCFPNGNGRHSRLIGDILINKIFKQPLFSWGAANLAEQGAARTAYLQALRAADAGDMEPLMVFARS